jgi:hypothetical protein
MSNNAVNDKNIIVDNLPEKVNNKAGRPKKTNKYIIERKKILDDILLLLGITEKNKFFYIEDIDIDKDKKDKIIALADEVKRYFRCSNWSYFVKTVPYPWLSISKSILKDMKVVIRTTSIRDNKKRIVLKRGYIVDN